VDTYTHAKFHNDPLRGFLPHMHEIVRTLFFFYFLMWILATLQVPLPIFMHDTSYEIPRKDMPLQRKLKVNIWTPIFHQNCHLGTNYDGTLKIFAQESLCNREMLQSKVPYDYLSPQCAAK